MEICVIIAPSSQVSIQNMKMYVELPKVGPKPIEASARRKLQEMITQNSLLHLGMLQSIIRQTLLDFLLQGSSPIRFFALLKAIFESFENVSQTTARYAWLSFEFLE